MIPFRANRSYRRFYQDQDIPQEHLKLMIEAARLSPSSRNVQPIKFYINNNREMNAKIFPHLGWAGYLKEWDGPLEGERPAGYVLFLHDKSISATYSCDNGIFAQSILLQAVDLGWGGCMIASINKHEISKLLDLPQNLDPILIIALGKPKETIVIDNAKDGEIKYWREADGTHHVPKRALEELIWNL